MANPSDLRDGVSSLAVLANNDLAALWRQVSTAVQAREALQDVLPALVMTYGLAAATIAADWYDEARDEAAVAGRFFAIPADVDESGADVLARWGVDPLFKAEPDWDAAKSLIAGGLQRRIANGARQTVALSSVEDPGADGWQRVGDGKTCAFCSMLIGRGAVYSERTADFASHDHCGCGAAPAFKGQPRPVKPYTPSLRTASKADKARVREYLRTH